MESDVKIFHSFAESDRADRAYYHSLTPSERMSILLELINQRQDDEAGNGLERVYRIVKLHES